MALPEEVLGQLFGAGALAGLAAFAGVILLFLLAYYVFVSIAVYVISKKLGDSLAWLALIPILNVLAFPLLFWRASETPVWSVIVVYAAFVLSAIPVLGTLAGLASLGITAWWLWIISGRRGHAEWLGLVASLGNLIPLIGTIISAVALGLIAFSDKSIGK